MMLLYHWYDESASIPNKSMQVDMIASDPIQFSGQHALRAS
jgi:hypothetical protein